MIKLEENFSLPTGDGKKIYGIINYSSQAKSDRIVVLSHGVTGSPHEHIHYCARRYFNQYGYDVVRFAYYASADDARKLHDCTVRIHANDLNAVLDYFRHKYKKLFVAGHSYGGLAILFANPEATAFSFWDSSFLPTFLGSVAKPLPGTNYYTLNFGTLNLLGKAICDEAKNLTETQVQNLAGQIKAPSQVIIAGQAKFEKNPYALYEALKCRKELLEIKDADHRFTTNNTLDELLDKTHEWFEKW